MKARGRKMLLLVMLGFWVPLVGIIDSSVLVAFGESGSEADGERCDTPQHRTPRHPRHRQPAAIPASRGVIF